MRTQGKLAKLAARAITGCLLLGFTTLARAQSDAVPTLYASAANVPTNIPGIHTYANPPKGFNPVTATDVDLATHGFPPRPDKQADPDSYAQWERAMRAAKVRWNGELKPLHGGGNLMTASGSRLAEVVHPEISGPTPLSTLNASGIVLTNKQKVWSNIYSFNSIRTLLTVPTTGIPFGVSCGVGGGIYEELSYVGIDGFVNVFDGQNVFNPGVWGVVYTTLGCGEHINIGYFAAFGAGGANTYNAFEILEGDVFLVEINVLEASHTSSVFLEDITLQTFNSYTISTPDILGDDAEWIVGRPIGGQGPGPDGVFALANTVAVNFNNGVATNGDAKSYYPGSQAASTYKFSMTDDTGDQPTEIMYGQGSSGYQGLTSLLFTTEACAYSGGCAP
jgi:hypothetical protein